MNKFLFFSNSVSEKEGNTFLEMQHEKRIFESHYVYHGIPYKTLTYVEKASVYASRLPMALLVTDLLNQQKFYL